MVFKFDYVIGIDNNFREYFFGSEGSTEWRKKMLESNFQNYIHYNMDVRKMDCMDFLEKTKSDFDIIFADPPYNFEHYHKLKDNIFSNNLVRKDGCLIIEHDSSTNFDEENVELRKYGSVHFSIFTN